ncbi:hypothetical protein PHACT_12000 [Pseudohongiella acticola]|jgi:Methyltransferase domain|uniref:Methyltransferase domain-containing protein n=1 Tax=Pseudohongiella acticola TaxID=1524254 RepID=A0A1E8CND7_9GAMM|nr:class I SAM-dependent methyltransferase [Pseudohongiella acticola]OFE13767.1 hypothetical protein PHACT_12000 [Pseudohongiella acticola]
MNDLYLPESLERYQLPWPQRHDRWLPHLPLLYDLAASLHPTLVVDLTLGDGEQASFAFCQAIKDHQVDSLVYAFGKADDPDTSNRYNRDHYAGFSYQLDAAPDQPEQRFAPQSIDLLHIDCQKEADAAATVSRWLPLIRAGGVLVLHAINTTPALWQDCQRHGQASLFPAGEGLGVLRLAGGTDVAIAGHTPLLGLLAGVDGAEQEQLCRLYEHVAAHVSLRASPEA